MRKIKQTSRKIPEVIQMALERFKLASEADEEWRQNCLDDLDFSIGNQWPLTIQTIREKDGRPCLVMDQIQQSIRLVCNQYRQQPPSLDISPVGDGADTDTADVLKGMTRHTEVISDGQVVYEKTHEGMVRAGFHSLRLLSEYQEGSDGQEVYIRWIKNAFSVYWQPGVPQEDAKWAFIIADVPVDEYNEDYKDSELANASDWTSTGNSPPEWINKNYYRIAEYFEVIETERKDAAPKKKVIWRKINAYEVLDGGDQGKELPGTSIPIFTAWGDDIDVNGKRYVAGLVRNAKGPQRQYNYMVSGATELVALAPKAPWVVAEGQIKNNQVQWEQSNVRNIAVLTYSQLDVGGKPAPPPQRQTAEPPIAGLSQLIGQAAMDLKASLGLYDPSLGQRKGDESGSAIEKLQAQGNIATLNYADNMSRVIRRLGRSLIEWYRVVYDVPKVQRIINPDGTTDMVVIHNGEDQADDAQDLAEENEISRVFDIGTGRYDVIVSVGPTYQSKRQEAVATQMELLKVLPPQIAQNIVDITIRNMDIPGAKEIADRIKKMLPPNLVEGDPQDPAVKVQMLEAQLQQLGQQHSLMAKALTDATQMIQTKQVEQQGKVQISQAQEMSKQEIVRMQEATKLAVAQINASKDVNQTIAEQELEQYKLLHNSAHDIAMQKDQQAHEQQQAQMAAQQQAQQQNSDQQHDVGMAVTNAALAPEPDQGAA